jgi:hypothetical protein
MCRDRMPVGPDLLLVTCSPNNISEVLPTPRAPGEVTLLTSRAPGELIGAAVAVDGSSGILYPRAYNWQQQNNSF